MTFALGSRLKVEDNSLWPSSGTQLMQYLLLTIAIYLSV